MASLAKVYMTALCIIAFPVLMSAQSLPSQTTRRSLTPPGVDTTASTRADTALTNERKTTAIFLLQALAREAQTYRDQALRARIQARVADALWEVDNARARDLFSGAWEAADAASLEAARRVKEDRRSQVIKYGAAMWVNPPDFHAEILKLIERHDNSLSKEFLAKLEDSNRCEKISDDVADLNKLSQYLKPEVLSPNVAQQLKLAMHLLEVGDLAQAIQVADPVLGRVSMEGITFLSALREKNATAADQRYATLLANATTDATSDANTVSLLSSYAFTPFVYFTALANGAKGVSQARGTISAPSLSESLRGTFFRAAVQILLRPLPQPEDDRSSAGRKGAYLIIERLLPLFKLYAPDMAADLQAQLNRLMLDIQGSSRGSSLGASNSNSSSEDSAEDEMQDALDRIRRANGTVATDKAYANAALVAARKSDLRARDYADKIEDKEMREQIRAYVDLTAVNSALRRKDVEQGLRLARSGALTRVQRAWALAEVARLLKKSEKTRFMELLDEATSEAHSSSMTDPDRVNIMVLVATQFAKVDLIRTWEIMLGVVKIANAVPDYRGDDIVITARVRTDNVIMMANLNASGFNLASIFKALAQDDLFRAMDLARAFKSESPRSIAILAIADSVLSEKQKRSTLVSAQ
jgi:hypothetical protein